MSSGLPINTFSQADEYRKRYLATLALQVQNEAYNLQANQVYKQTGQPSRPPDMRSTTEKLGDLERLKVELRSGLLEITDGEHANETVENLMGDEITFATQQLPTIVADIKPKFKNGIPAQALLSYIRALRRKFLATNGVSFSAQEATSQQLINAIQAGQNVMGSPSGPFEMMPISLREPIAIGRINTPSNIESNLFELIRSNNEMENLVDESQKPTKTPIKKEKEIIDLTKDEGTFAGQIQQLNKFKRDFVFQEKARQFGPNSIEEWDMFPKLRESWSPYKETEDKSVIFLKWWAESQIPDIQALFENNWNKKRKLSTLKQSLTPGVVAKLSMTQSGNDMEQDVFSAKTELNEYQPTLTGMGFYKSKIVRPVQTYRNNIVGYGLKTKSINVDMTQGLKKETPTFIPFGKYLVNPNILSGGTLDLKTKSGWKVEKYPTRKMSSSLTKIMTRMIGGRLPDEQDFNNLQEEDQNFLYDLAKDTKIIDRLNIPTPKRSKSDQHENRFEILKGEIMAGNNNKDLIKEFKHLLVQFSNDGRLKKTEAREILLDLAAMGY